MCIPPPLHLLLLYRDAHALVCTHSLMEEDEEEEEEEAEKEGVVCLFRREGTRGIGPTNAHAIAISHHTPHTVDNTFT